MPTPAPAAAAARESARNDDGRFGAQHLPEADVDIEDIGGIDVEADALDVATAKADGYDLDAVTIEHKGLESLLEDLEHSRETDAEVEGAVETERVIEERLRQVTEMRVTDPKRRLDGIRDEIRRLEVHAHDAVMAGLRDHIRATRPDVRYVAVTRDDSYDLYRVTAMTDAAGTPLATRHDERARASDEWVGQLDANDYAPFEKWIAAREREEEIFEAIDANDYESTMHVLDLDAQS